MLTTISCKTNAAKLDASYRESQALQEAQLGIDRNPELRDVYKESYIINVKLDEAHKERLDAYIEKNNAHCDAQQLSQQKQVIREYLGAQHNYGKKMQQVICSYFFPPVPVVKAEPKPYEITMLPSEARPEF
jgi:hypothetical protein